MSTPILFVDHAPAIGGAEKSLLLLLTHLDRTQWELHLAGTGGLLLDRAAAHGVVPHRIDMPRLRRASWAWRVPLDWFSTARRLAGLANDIDAALLYANTVRAAFYAAPAARLARRPFVWHMRDFWLSESKPRYVWLDSLLKRLLCVAATHVIANSHAVAEHLPAGAPLTVVHNGIELKAFDPMLDGRAFRAAHDVPADVPLVGMMGRLRPWKGQSRFLRMATRVRAAVPEAHFIIVGGTPFGEISDYARRLRRLTHELNLTDAVTFTGHLDDVAPALAAMDVFVHPGDPEPFGLVNVEAMAMRMPVIAFTHGALPEIVVDGETGLLVAPDQTAALARSVIDLLQNPDRRKALGRAARERVVAHFDVEQTACRVDALLSAVCEEHAAGSHHP